MMPPLSFKTSTFVSTLLLVHATAHALPVAPATLSRSPSALSSEVTLSWSAVPGATGYNVKRGTSPASALTTLGTVTTTTYTDATATPGTTYFYTVTTNDATGESPPTRGIMAATAVIVDNGGAGTSSTGSWAASSVAGYYGTGALFASPVSGSTPTATYTFTPDLPARGNYDVYMRWTTNANRATDTPVDLVFPDGIRTVTVNQEQNNGVWMLLTNITAEAGTTASVTIRNNGANGNVIADAVQFVPAPRPVGSCRRQAAGLHAGSPRRSLRWHLSQLIRLEHLRRARRTQCLRRTPPYQAPLQRHRPHRVRHHRRSRKRSQLGRGRHRRRSRPEIRLPRSPPPPASTSRPRRGHRLLARCHRRTPPWLRNRCSRVLQQGLQRRR